VQGVFVAPIEGTTAIPYLEVACRQRLFSVLSTLDIVNLRFTLPALLHAC
jgi:hypothetical protein